MPLLNHKKKLNELYKILHLSSLNHDFVKTFFTDLITSPFSCSVSVHSKHTQPDVFTGIKSNFGTDSGCAQWASAELDISSQNEL